MSESSPAKSNPFKQHLAIVFPAREPGLDQGVVAGPLWEMTAMASWIESRMDLTETSPHYITLGGTGVYMVSWDDVPGNTETHHISFEPTSRESANRMSIALRNAAKRLEDIGKKLQ